MPTKEQGPETPSQETMQYRNDYNVHPRQQPVVELQISELSAAIELKPVAAPHTCELSINAPLKPAAERPG